MMMMMIPLRVGGAEHGDGRNQLSRLRGGSRQGEDHGPPSDVCLPPPPKLNFGECNRACWMKIY